MGEHEKGGKHHPDNLIHSTYDSKHSICQPDDILFMAYVATVEKILAYGLGEHGPGSARDGRTSSEIWSPAPHLILD